jgi:quercetin dioxygenase-like cupin family protein
MKVVHLDEIEPFFMEWAGVNWKPLRAELDVRAFGTNAYSGEAGDTVVEEHTEGTGHQEMYVVVRGRATFTLDGREVDAPAGTVVFLDDPDVKRHARAEEPRTLVLAVGNKVGEPFKVSVWEYLWRSFRARTQDRWDEARRIVEEGLREQPESPGLKLALAAVEAHEGKQDEARDHMREAIAANESMRQWAEGDAELAPLLADL